MDFNVLKGMDGESGAAGASGSSQVVCLDIRAKEGREEIKEQKDLLVPPVEMVNLVMRGRKGKSVFLVILAMQV